MNEDRERELRAPVFHHLDRLQGIAAAVDRGVDGAAAAAGDDPSEYSWYDQWLRQQTPRPGDCCACGQPVTFVYLMDTRGGGQDVVAVCDEHADSASRWEADWLKSVEPLL
jgi:hypothetical protein